MNFDFSEDQHLLRDNVRKFLQKESPFSTAREVLEQQQTHSKHVWKGLVDMGISTLMLPESCGGIGLGALELCVVAEEVGRQLSPVPLSSSLYLAAQVLLLGSSEDQQQEWLTRISRGDIATVAAPIDGYTKLLPNYSKGKLTGKAELVPDAMSAEFVIVLARDSVTNAPVWVVSEFNTSTKRCALATIDGARPFGSIEFEGTAAEPLEAVSDANKLLEDVRNRAAVLFAFEQLGGADAITEISSEYARERKAFGRAIGSYQGIKHKLADMYTNNQMARVHCYYGAWALASDSAELALAAAGARVMASRAFNYAAQESIEIHGGMGYTWEVDCHLFYRRTRQLSLLLGAEALWNERVSAALIEQLGAGS